jgi:PAS domain S-box-containing protein
MRTNKDQRHDREAGQEAGRARKALATARGTEILSGDTREQYRQKIARITLDSMVQFVGLLDAQGAVLEINKVALDAAGIQLADVEGKPFWETFWWQVSEEINATLQDSIRRAAQGEFVRWDTPIYGRAGGKETIIIDASLMPVKDEHGKVVFIAAEGRDITEKKAYEREIARQRKELAQHLGMAGLRHEAEQRLRLSEERYRTLIDLLPVAVYTCEAPTGVITFYNEHAATLWGRTPNEGDTDVRFCGSFRLWRPDGTLLPHDQAPMALALRDGHEFRNEDVVIERPDGTRIHALVNINPIRDETGRITGAINAFQNTAALRQAQELLQEQQRILQLTTEAAQIGTWQWDIKTGELIWSAIQRQLWGYEPTSEPITYADWSRLVEKSDLAQAEEAIALSLRSKAEYDVEYRIKPRHKNESRWIRSIGRTFFNEADEPVLMRGVSLDITARKKAEESLRHRTEQFAALLNQAPIGVYLVDSDFKIREVNPIAVPVFGRIGGGVIGRDFDEIIHILWEKQYADEIVGIFRHTLQTGEPYVTPERVGFRIDRGKSEYYEWRVNRITLSDGRHGLVCYFRDISEQVLARQTIAESEQRFRAIADAMPQIVWAARPDGHVDYYNERWYEYTGLPSGELGQSAWELILHADDVQPSVEGYRRCVEAGTPYEIECRFKDRKTGGYRWFMGRALPIRDQQGQIVRWFGTFTDIDDQKRLEEQLRNADRRKDEFLAMLGHELRNPLAAINTGITLLESDVPEERRLWVQQMMTRQMQQVQRLVDDLLDVARITQGKIQLRKEQIELRQPLEVALEAVRGLLEKRRHRLTTSISPEDLSLPADPARLEQILVNLLTNAAKYTPDGGEIRLSAERSDSEVILRCRDNGVGLSREMLDLVFDPFVQGEPAFERTGTGLGMGLTLVKRLAEMHGGTVTVSSGGRGMGSEFVLRLPAFQTDPAEAAEQVEEASVSQSESLRSAKILLIDDNRDLAEGFAFFLRRAGCEVILANDGETGIPCAERERPAAVLLDLGLPGIDGYTVAARLRANPALRNTVIIAISGYQPVKDEKTRRARFDGHLVKPIAYDRLLRILQEKLAAREASDAARSSRRILLIEDNSELAVLTAELLRRHGQEVAVAPSGEEGLVKALAFSPEVVFCDLNLPGKDGFETARLLRKQYGSKPLLIAGLTAGNVEQYLAYEGQTPFDLFVGKPLVWSKVCEMLEEFDGDSPPPARRAAVE